MKRKWQLLVVFFAVGVVTLSVLVPLAAARLQPGAGQVASTLGSPDPREHSPGLTYYAGFVPTHLGSQDPRDTYREVLGDAGFGIQKLNEQDVFAPTAATNAASANWAAKAKLLDVNGQPRRDIFKSAALEHGAAGFGNVFLGETKTTARSVIAPDYSHLPQEDRAGITHRGI